MDQIRTGIIVNGVDTDLCREHTNTFAFLEHEMESNANENAVCKAQKIITDIFFSRISLIKCVAEIKFIASTKSNAVD